MIKNPGMIPDPMMIKRNPAMVKKVRIKRVNHRRVLRMEREVEMTQPQGRRVRERRALAPAEAMMGLIRTRRR